MSPSIVRAAVLAAGLSCLALPGCRDGADVAAGPASLLAELREQPGRLPPEPPPGTALVLLAVGLGDGEIRVLGETRLEGGSLRLERALARRRTNPPPYWALLIEPDGSVRYWAPFDPAPRVRVNLPIPAVDQSHVEPLFEVPRVVVSLELPRLPDGEVAFFAADGTASGRYRLANGRPDAEREEVAQPPAGAAFVEEPAGGCSPLPTGWSPERFDLAQCPQVYRIHGDAPLDRSLNLLLLPAGFTARELDDFRCGAGLMVERLLAFEPFRCFADSINVYRIDLASETSGVGGEDCSGSGPCPHEPLDWEGKAEECAAYERLHHAAPTRPPGRYSADCLALDLEVRACPPGAPFCKVLWPSEAGQHLAALLSACAPAMDVAIVMAHSEEWAGGGIETPAQELHRMAVVTFRGVDAMATRSMLLAHELGHALGLLDEYVDTTTFDGDPPEFVPGRNLVKAAPDGALPAAPWASRCVDASGHPGPCEVRRRCEVAPGASQPSPVVGLYEGGFYSECGYFTSTTYCRMEDSMNDEYCPACLLHLETLFRDDLHMTGTCTNRGFRGQSP